jgi:hypothetical protein
LFFVTPPLLCIFVQIFDRLLFHRFVGFSRQASWRFSAEHLPSSSWFPWTSVPVFLGP